MSSEPGGDVRVPVPDRDAGSYRVEVRRGGLERLGERCAVEVGAVRYAVIADERVAGLYGERALRSLEAAGSPGELFTFPPGEESKDRREWARLSDRMLEAGLGRDAGVVALGGGVTGDLAGFVAATYMRGLPLVQVPTSVLAMLDSSVGGKVGVNTGAGKNLVGAFHHPRHVLADPALLETLDPRHRRAGLAEAVKAAALADPQLLTWLEEEAEALSRGEPAALETAILRSVGIKAEVVGRDPEERGERAVLNFGHTLGHGLEAASGYGLLHGEAVALGMRLEARLGQERGVTEAGTADRLDRLLRKLDLGAPPADLPSAERVMACASSDKKRRRGELRFVFLAEAGRVARPAGGGYTHAVERDGCARWLDAALPSMQEA